MSRPSLRFLWGTAAVLLLLLAALGLATEHGRERRTVLRREVRLPEEPRSRIEAGEVVISEPFALEGPTTLELRLRQEGGSGGWVFVDVALVNDEDGDLRELGLATSAIPPETSDETSVLVDQIETGPYRIRFESRWQPAVAPAPGRRTTGAPPSPPRATLTATTGTSTPWLIGVAALFIMAPAAFETVRRRGKSF